MVALKTRLIFFCGGSGVAAGAAFSLVGGWDLALETLCIVMGLDYITGLLVAGFFGRSPKSPGGALESRAAFKGLCKKALVLVIVIAFHQADRITGKSFFRDGACWAFFLSEMISITENVGLIYPLPKFIQRAVDWFVLQGKGEGTDKR